MIITLRLTNTVITANKLDPDMITTSISSCSLSWCLTTSHVVAPGLRTTSIDLSMPRQPIPTRFSELADHVAALQGALLFDLPGPSLRWRRSVAKLLYYAPVSQTNDASSATSGELPSAEYTDSVATRVACATCIAS